MPVDATDLDPGQWLAHVPRWIGSTRAELNLALGELERGVASATGALAAGIAADSEPEILPSLEQIAAHCGLFLVELDKHLEVLFSRIGAHLAEQIAPLHELAAQLDELVGAPLLATPRAAQQALRQRHAELQQYVAGFVEGGGLALALYVALPPELAAHTAQVEAVLSERVAFVPRRAELAIGGWIAEVRGQIDELLLVAAEDRQNRAPVDATPDLPARLRDMVDRATASGIRLGRIPHHPTAEWLEETEARLAQAIARRDEEQVARQRRDAAARGERTAAVTDQAARLGVVIEHPPLVTDDWLERAELRLASFLVTPLCAPRVVDPRRVERFREVWVAAHARGVDLGDVPDALDAEWLAWAEERLADAPDASPLGEWEEVLVLEEGTVQELVWRGLDDRWTIGRHRTNDVQIAYDPGVSRRHCTILRVDGHYLIRDAGSAKGTIVNGVRVDEARLVGGEKILVSDTELAFYVR